MTGRILIDGHVHFYPSARLDRILAGAGPNLAEIGAAGTDYVLCLTETARDTAFAALRTGQGVPEGWRIDLPERDEAALCLSGPDGAWLLVIAGRQIVTAEGLEVLGLCTDARIEDGLPVRDVLARLDAAEVPAVLPWGLGKWIGRRGALVRQLIEEGNLPFSLGDNAGRPVGWPRPPTFALARDRGRAILPGTDPLPVPGAEDAIGRFGFALPGRLDPSAPARDLASRLRTLKGQPEVLGTRRTWPRVIAEQIALRRHKRG